MRQRHRDGPRQLRELRAVEIADEQDRVMRPVYGHDRQSVRRPSNQMWNRLVGVRRRHSVA